MSRLLRFPKTLFGLSFYLFIFIILIFIERSRLCYLYWFFLMTFWCFHYIFCGSFIFGKFYSYEIYGPDLRYTPISTSDLRLNAIDAFGDLIVLSLGKKICFSVYVGGEFYISFLIYVILTYGIVSPKWSLRIRSFIIVGDKICWTPKLFKSSFCWIFIFYSIFI